MIGLALGFFVTALVYALAGFGGGSTYNALLVLAEVDYRVVPILALCCNIIVVTVGSWRFASAGHIDWRRIGPLVVLSVPMAWLGGRLEVPELLFVGLLARVIAGRRAADAVAAALAGRRRRPAAGKMARARRGRHARLPRRGGRHRRGHLPRAPAVYAALGQRARHRRDLRLLHPRQFDRRPRRTARQGSPRVAAALADHWLLFPAVLMGGLVGSLLGSERLDPRHVRIVTALLVLYVAVRLCIRFYDETIGAAS